MTAGLEALTVAEWVISRLSQDAQLQALAGGPDELLDRIWEGEYAGSAPKNVPGFWWISFTVEDPVDVKGVGLVQLMARAIVQVKVVARGDAYEIAAPAYQRAHELLEAQINQATTSGLVLTCGRVSGFQYPERDAGMEYRHLGGRYEALSQ